MQHITLLSVLQANEFFFRNKIMEIINVIAGSILLVIMAVTMIAFTRRGINCRRQDMRW